MISDLIFFLFTVFITTGCTDSTNLPVTLKDSSLVTTSLNTNHDQFEADFKTIHVMVALCDNRYQGIIPVPAGIGNGQDPDHNLYWGCGYGVSSYFRKSRNWTMVRSTHLDSIKLERLVFRSKKGKYYLVADAYNGKYIKQCTIDFLKSCAGQLKDTLHIDGNVIGIFGNAALLAYTGHDGLMDFQLPQNYKGTGSNKRKAIILACMSKRYFHSRLSETGAEPLLWSTGLMSPEAYTLHDALESYMNNETADRVRNSAANAYAKYQHCSVHAAKNLLVTGW